MASLGLAQIDENSSLASLGLDSRTSGNDPLVLPNLLSHSTPQFDSAGEKTPEVWPKTPTPQDTGFHPRLGFALGDQTPEAWPAFAPSFCIDMQQPANYQEAAINSVPLMPSPAITGVPSLMPMWPGQIAYPLGMVFGGAVSQNPMPPPLSNNAPYRETSLGQPADCVADTAHLPKAPVDRSTSKPKTITASKKPVRAAHTEVGADDDACPVAVYVDLSALRERGSPFAQGGCRVR